MTCDDVASLVTAMVDGELPDAEAAGVRGHAAGCDRCAQRLRGERAIRRGLRALPEPMGGPPPWSSVRQALRGADAREAQTPHWRLRVETWWRQSRWLFAGGAVVAAAAAIVLRIAASTQAPVVAGERIEQAAMAVAADTDVATASLRADVAELTAMLEQDLALRSVFERATVQLELAGYARVTHQATGAERLIAYETWTRVLQRKLLWDHVAEAR